jgi:hypothetical protein
MVFAVGGQRALDEIHKACFTVVIPDGVAVLNEARAPVRWPCRSCSRATPRDRRCRAVPDLHRLIHKPRDAGTLRQAIEHAIDAARPRE